MNLNYYLLVNYHNIINIIIKMGYGTAMSVFVVGSVSAMSISIWRNIKLRRFFDPRKV